MPSQRNGGLYPSHYGGALKTILSYAANARHVTYLDDDNWYAPDHVATMLAAISGNAWAFSLRQFVDADSGDILAPIRGNRSVRAAASTPALKEASSTPTAFSSTSSRATTSFRNGR